MLSPLMVSVVWITVKRVMGYYAEWNCFAPLDCNVILNVCLLGDYCCVEGQNSVKKLVRRCFSNAWLFGYFIVCEGRSLLSSPIFGMSPFSSSLSVCVSLSQLSEVKVIVCSAFAHSGTVSVGVWGCAARLPASANLSRICHTSKPHRPFGFCCSDEQFSIKAHERVFAKHLLDYRNESNQI